MPPRKGSQRAEQHTSPVTCTNPDWDDSDLVLCILQQHASVSRRMRLESQCVIDSECGMPTQHGKLDHLPIAFSDRSLTHAVLTKSLLEAATHLNPGNDENHKPLKDMFAGTAQVENVIAQWEKGEYDWGTGNTQLAQEVSSLRDTYTALGTCQTCPMEPERVSRLLACSRNEQAVNTIIQSLNVDHSGRAQQLLDHFDEKWGTILKPGPPNSGVSPDSLPSLRAQSSGLSTIASLSKFFTGAFERLGTLAQAGWGTATGYQGDVGEEERPLEAKASVSMEPGDIEPLSSELD